MRLKKPELLFITQSLDPERKALGFTTDWVNALRNHFDITTISQDSHNHQIIEEKKYTIGNNGKIKKLLNYVFLIYKLGRKSDGLNIFVHMIPIYALILLPFKKFLKIKKIYLWFAHKNKPFYFKILDNYLDGIFTTSKHAVSNNYKKVKYLGHGISSDRFNSGFVNKKINEKVEFIYVGRISPIKNIQYILTLINKVSISTRKKISLILVGSTVTKSDEEYMRHLNKLLLTLDGRVDCNFVGEINFNQVQKYYGNNSFGINASPRGAMDKAPIEGIFAGAPFFYINDAYNDLYEMCPNLRGRMQIKGDLELDTLKVIDVIGTSNDFINDSYKQLLNEAERTFGLKNFIHRLASELKK